MYLKASRHREYNLPRQPFLCFLKLLLERFSQCLIWFFLPAIEAHCFLLCKAWAWRTDCTLSLCNSSFYTWHIIWCDFMGLYVHQGLRVKMMLIWSHRVKNKWRTNAHLFANKDSEDKTENLPYVFTSWNSFNILLFLHSNVLWSLLLRSFSWAISLARSPQSMDGKMQGVFSSCLRGDYHWCVSHSLCWNFQHSVFLPTL